MAVAYIDSASINNLTVSGFFGTVGSANTASMNISVDGGAATQVSQLVFSSANSHTFGLNANSLTLSYNPPSNVRSYYINPDPFGGMTTAAAYSLGASTQPVMPFILDEDLSFDYVRIPVSYTFSSTTIATQAGVSTYSLGQTQNFYANIYSLGTGSNSAVLQTVATGSFNMRVSVQISWPGGAGSTLQNFTYNLTYAATGSTYATQVNWASNSATAYSIVTTQLSGFSGLKFLDIPLGTSLTAGPYFMVFQKSTTTGTGGATAMVNLTHNNTNYIITQANLRFGQLGENSTGVTNNLRYGLKYGLGYYTTSNNGATTNSISLNAANFSIVASHPQVPFQLIKS